MRRVSFRLCSSAALLRAAEEADRLCPKEEQLGLYRNACLLAQVVYGGKRRLFRDGTDVLRRLPAEAVACWMGAYADLCRSHSWQARLDALRQDQEQRLRWKVLRTFGVLPSEPRAKLTHGQLLDCVLHLLLDDEQRLAALCPTCREALTDGRCPVCGAVTFDENPYFDRTRFEELKHRGLSDVASAEASGADTQTDVACGAVDRSVVPGRAE